MKQIAKRLLSMALVLVMVLSMLPAVALPAAAAEQAGNQDKVRRWQQLRSGPLSTENVCALLQHSSDELIRSGAQVREDVRWPVRDSDTTLEEIQTYMTLRLEALDAYYAGL